MPVSSNGGRGPAQNKGGDVELYEAVAQAVLPVTLAASGLQYRVGGREQQHPSIVRESVVCG